MSDRQTQVVLTSDELDPETWVLKVGWRRRSDPGMADGFTATLHRLRRILDEDDAVILRDARLSLNPRLCWVDSWALEGVLADLDGTLRESPAGAAVPDLRPLVEEAIALYRGPFLPDESEQPSYIAFRDQTRSKLLRCLSRVTRRWEDAGMGDAAVECLQRIIDTDELGEGFYRNLMMVYQRRGETGEALSTYERLRTVLAMRLKAMPSQETQAVYAGLSAPGSAMPAPRE